MAMVIFTLASVIIAEIFVNVQRAQQRVRDTQVALTELRYLMDVLAREVRSDMLDYTAGGCSGATTSTLAASADALLLCSGQGEPIAIRHVSLDACANGFVGGCVQFKRGSSDWNAISSAQLSIDALYFYPAPLTNPFPSGGATSATPDIQPRVTIVLKASSLSVKPQDRRPLYLQTSVTARTYAR